MWIEVLQSYFPPAVRARGDEYLRRIAVRDLDESSLHAHVQGNNEYCVKIEREGAALFAACSCPHFEEAGPCKHLWAVLRYAHSAGRFAARPTLITLHQLAPFDDRHTPKGQLLRFPRKAPDWREAFVRLRSQSTQPAREIEPGAELIYILDVQATLAGHGTVVEVATRARKRDGEWAKPRALTMPVSSAAQLADPEDREIVPLLAALAAERAYSYGYSIHDRELPRRVTLPVAVSVPLVARIAATGRLYLRTTDTPELLPCPWLGGAPYALRLAVRPSDDAAELILRAELERAGDVRDIRDARLLLPGGMVFFSDHAARGDFSPGDYQWIRLLVERSGELRIPASEGEALADELNLLPDSPRVELPAALRFEERRGAPKPWLVLRSPAREAYSDKLAAELRFDYDGVVVDSEDPRPRVKRSDSRVVIVRDGNAEATAAAQLPTLGFRRERNLWVLPPKKLAEVVCVLAAQGWRIEADGKRPSARRARSRSTSSPGSTGSTSTAKVRLRRAARVAAAAAPGGANAAASCASTMARSALLPERVAGAPPAARRARRRRRRRRSLQAQPTRPARRAAVDDAGGARRRGARAGARRARPLRRRSCEGARRAASSARCATISARASAGSSSCATSASAAAWPTTWASARPSRCWRCSAARAPRQEALAGRRADVAHVQLEPEAARFTPELRVLDHHGRLAHRSPISTSTISSSPPTARCAATSPSCAGIDFDYAILDEAQAIKNAAQRVGQGGAAAEAPIIGWP